MPELGGDSLRLGYLLRFQALALEHVHEIGVTTKIKLIGAIQPHAAIAEKIRQDTMGDRRADLRFDVVANNRQTGFLETPLPVRLRGDENRDAIDETTPRLKDLLDIPLRRRFGANR